VLKGNRKYIFFLAICFTLLIALQVLSPKAINWKLSYSSRDKIPYGTFALYSVLEDIFPGQTIENKTFPLYNILNKTEFQHSNYIIINQKFEPDSLDTRELLRFVKQGNSVFISANNFSEKISKALKIKTDNYWNYGNNFSNDSATFSNIYNSSDTVQLHFTNKLLQKPKSYFYSKAFENVYFSKIDTGKTIVLGENQFKKINFIKVQYGKGTFFLNSVPEAFSNYHFVSSNHDYVYTALSYLPVQPIFWDEYYKAGNVKSESPLRVLFSNEALLSAYYLLLFSLLLFMIIGIKRKQRIIPVIEPLKNTTLQFVDVVGTLYYQTGNHKNIADKKINYFLEYIRNNFQVKTNLYDDLFISRISNLSGIALDKVHELFYYFSDISIKKNIAQEELLQLNKLIENFHKESKR